MAALTLGDITSANATPGTSGTSAASPATLTLTGGNPWTPGYGVLGGPAAPTTPNSLAATASSAAASAGTTALNDALPGYMTSMNNIGTNIASETAGQVPQDVIAELQQQGAEGNTTTGAASNAAYLKALGLTSLGLEQTGQQNLEGIEPSIPGYTISQNPSFATTSAQSLSIAEDQANTLNAINQQQQEYQQQQEALNAAQAGAAAGNNAWNTPTNSWSGSGALPTTTSSAWSASAPTAGGQNPSVTSFINNLFNNGTLPSSGSVGTTSWNAAPVAPNFSSEDDESYG
jgi:hypothetical protein